MPLHLIKLCVGIERVEQLTAEGRALRGRSGEFVVHTRQTPKRAAELVDDGSLFWVIKGVVACRQRVLRVDTLGGGPMARCQIILDPDVIRVAPSPRRAFQGWRYLTVVDAPPDLTAGEAAALPVELARELRALGAW